MLRRWLLFPLTHVGTIRRRQDAVAHLVERAALRAELRARLADVHDMERLAGRVTLGAATPRDLVSLRRSLERVPDLVAASFGPRSRANLSRPAELHLAFPVHHLYALPALAAEIVHALVDEPPAQTPREGGLVRPGQLDRDRR